MTIDQIKAALVDIEVSALELSVGNFTANKFKSDCEHIAEEARELRDYFVSLRSKTEKLIEEYKHATNA